MLGYGGGVGIGIGVESVELPPPRSHEGSIMLGYGGRYRYRRRLRASPLTPLPQRPGRPWCRKGEATFTTKARRHEVHADSRIDEAREPSFFAAPRAGIGAGYRLRRGLLSDTGLGAVSRHSGQRCTQRSASTREGQCDKQSNDATGDERIRTANPLRAKQVLSQLELRPRVLYGIVDDSCIGNRQQPISHRTASVVYPSILRDFRGEDARRGSAS